MPRYWFITALGFVIVVSAIINYLNQPIEMAVDRSVAVASAPVTPRPSATEPATPVASNASQAPPAKSDDTVSDQPESGQILADTELSTPQDSTLAVDAEPQSDPQLAASETPAAELQAEFAEVEQIGGVTEPEQHRRPDVAAVVTPASDATEAVDEIDVKGAAQAVVADAASPPAEDVADQAGGWLVEASGGFSASEIGQSERGPLGVDTLLSAKSEGISQPDIEQRDSGQAPAAPQAELLEAEVAGDDEVAAILAETASLARRNLGLPEEEPGPSVSVQTAALTEGDASASPQSTSDSNAETVAAIPAWEADAANVPPSDGPMVAVIIDDLGWSARRTSMVSTLSNELTLAMLTDADDAPRQANQARELGHELLIHVPMQAAGTTIANGAQLDVSMTEEELRQAVDAAVETIDGAIGINNHMGSLFTADETSMRVVLDQVRRHGLIYVDSLTTAESVAEGIAEEIGVPYLRRDVFLDNERDSQAIAGQLAKLEEIAQRRGWAIGIGHPYIETIDALAAWIPTLKRKGIDLIPVSTLIRLRQQDTQTAERPTNG